MVMKTIRGKEAGEFFEKFKRETKKKVFKLETLQYYGEDAENPSLQKWLSGSRDESSRILQKNAGEMAVWWPKDPKIRKTRVHIVEYPLSEYIQWEIEAYKYVNIPFCGEEVYLMDSKDVSDYGELSEGWIYDDNRAIIVNYDKDGRSLEFEVYEGDEVKPLLEIRDRLLKLPLKNI